MNNLNEEFNYNKLVGVDNIYIPLRFFLNSRYINKIKEIVSKFNTYILMPTVSRGNYEKINVQEIIKQFNIKGTVISNLSQIEEYNGLNLIADYSLNVMNDYTVEELKEMGISKITLSPETDRSVMENLGSVLKKEIIVYGRTRLMITEYCAIGTYKNCNGMCEGHNFKLKDRMGFEFPIKTDRINCNNMIYNSVYVPLAAWEAVISRTR